MNKNIAIKVQSLTKTYKLYSQPIDRLKESLNPFKKTYHQKFNALDNISFEIRRGETVGIIGKNGSGKSTLLKLITGVLTPTSGRVTVHGKIAAILELGAGFNPEMTGLENVYLNTSINGMTKAKADTKIDEILAFAELGEFIHQPIKTYSSGMKARLAFAVSINVEPDILIVDEALSVGDAAFSRKCFAKMEEIRKSGSTILFVSHNEGSIVNLCSRAIWISNGQKVIDSKPKLVAGLYMKNINEKNIDRIAIENEINTLLANEDTTKNNAKQKIQNQQHKTQNIQPKSSTTSSTIEEYFNPSLNPKSTINYEVKGARISDVKITKPNSNKAINVLQHNKEYVYKYNVEFFTNPENVEFAFLIKTKKGIGLAGGAGSLADYKDIKVIDKKTFSIEWTFKCIFNPGDYYLNAGVSSNKDYLHRIIDAYAFKVMPMTKHIATASTNCVSNLKIKND